MQSHFKVGEKYLIRGVIFFYTGEVVSVNEKEIVLKDAAWVTSTGRFNKCLVTGEIVEAEPFPDPVIVSRDTIVDATVWKHKLPREFIE